MLPIILIPYSMGQTKGLFLPRYSSLDYTNSNPLSYIQAKGGLLRGTVGCVPSAC